MQRLVPSALAFGHAKDALFVMLFLSFFLRFFALSSQISVRKQRDYSAPAVLHNSIITQIKLRCKGWGTGPETRAGLGPEEQVR